MTIEHQHSTIATTPSLSFLAKTLRTAVLVLASQVTLLGCNGSEDGATESPPLAPADSAGDQSSLPVFPVLADYGETGAYRAGFRAMSSPGSDLVVKSWYPTLDEGRDSIEYEFDFKADYYGSETGTILGHAIRGASIAAAQDPFPVVVFSHGFSMNPEWYSDLVEHLASRGFVVMAPEHEEGAWETSVIDASFERPENVHETIDLAEAMNEDDGAFAQSLDLQRVAVVGHSYGGYTALASAGARFDVESLKNRCSDLDPMDPKTFLCQPFISEEDVIQRLASASDGMTLSLSDSRVKAIVTIAGDAYLFGEDGLSAVSVPTFAIGGTGDNWSPWDWGAELTYSSVGSQKVALTGLQGADHMIAVNTCDRMPWTDGLPEEFASVFCEDVAWDRGEALAMVRSFVTSFLLDTLRDDSTARASLSSEVVDEAAVQYASSW